MIKYDIPKLNVDSEVTFETTDEQLGKKTYKETLIETIEQYLPISYEVFKKLSLDEQQKIIDEIKEKQGKKHDIFQQKFTTLTEDDEGKISLCSRLLRGVAKKSNGQMKVVKVPVKMQVTFAGLKKLENEVGSQLDRNDVIREKSIVKSRKY